VAVSLFRKVILIAESKELKFWPFVNTIPSFILLKMIKSIAPSCVVNVQEMGNDCNVICSEAQVGEKMLQSSSVEP
jgi:hypothetical protein